MPQFTEQELMKIKDCVNRIEVVKDNMLDFQPIAVFVLEGDGSTANCAMLKVDCYREAELNQKFRKLSNGQLQEWADEWHVTPSIVMQITKLSELAFDADNQGIFCPLILPDEADKTPDELTYHGKEGIEHAKQTIQENEQEMRSCLDFALWVIDVTKGERQPEGHLFNFRSNHPQKCYDCKVYFPCKLLHYSDNSDFRLK